jgi:cytochrome b subunit of formate dehydrogenase
MAAAISGMISGKIQKAWVKVKHIDEKDKIDSGFINFPG